MGKGNSLIEYKAFAAEWFRTFETRKAKHDEDKLRDIAQATDDEILRRWLWKITIVAAPVAFVVLPMVLMIVHSFLWLPMQQMLWFVTKTAMGLVFLLFILAVYLTFLRKDSG